MQFRTMKKGGAGVGGGRIKQLKFLASGYLLSCLPEGCIVGNYHTGAVGSSIYICAGLPIC